MLVSQYFEDSDDLLLYFRYPIEEGAARWQVPFDYQHPELGGIIADLTSTGEILGLEIGDARKRLSWIETEEGKGPQVVETYDQPRDEFRLTFGPGAARTLVVRDEMFPGFVAAVELDARGKVTGLCIPDASVQLGRLA